MFLFYHSNQQAKTVAHFKGVLFEQLLQRYLGRTGFAVELRRKHSSLEYDLEGVHTVDQRRVVGEAKAHDRPISGDIFSGFVGKLLPLGVIERECSGLFLSTSSLTAEADDYYHTLAAKYPGITVLTGEKLAEEIRRALSLPAPATLCRGLETHGLFPLSNHILATDLGVFIVVLASTAQSAAPAIFALFRDDGSILQDPAFLTKVSEATPELQALRGFTGAAVPQSGARQIGAGLAVGSSWDDYRLPAAPTLFVGRRSLGVDVLEHVRSGTMPRVLQIKSRSGVGKSSFLAYIESTLSADQVFTELHDARDIKSVFDLLSVVQRFTRSPLPAVDIEGAVTQLRNYGAALAHGERGVFMVDQFEATFPNPELFYAYEALLPAFNNQDKLVVVFARKNDLLTTYDETQISLQRLNSASRSHELRDFEVDEAVELIDRISGAIGRSVGASVKAFVLEFAQGFPWLIKRTMAHITRLLKQGAAQSELFATGLRLDELFDEELEGLDELERDYLARIAARLPADFSQLQREFDEDPLLPRLLDKLTSTRLLRMSGATYDTYNDVFKEYLLYRRLPEYRAAFIPRIFPQAVFRLFHKLIDRKLWSLLEIQAAAGASRGTTFNLLRELRNLGLLKKEGDSWAVPQVVRDVYARGNLSEYVRRHMMDNAVTSDLLERLNRQGGMPQGALPAHLQERFPFIQATDKTWDSYGRVMLSWLRALRLVEATGETLSLPQRTREELLEGLGNLTEVGRRPARGSRSTRDAFLPVAHWLATEHAAEMVLKRTRCLTNQDKKGVSNLRALGLLDSEGAPQFSDTAELRTKATEFLGREPYLQIWNRIEDGQPIEDVVRALDAPDVADATVAWRAKLFSHWGRTLGLIEQDTRKTIGGRRRRAKD